MEGRGSREEVSSCAVVGLVRLRTAAPTLAEGAHFSCASWGVANRYVDMIAAHGQSCTFHGALRLCSERQVAVRAGKGAAHDRPRGSHVTGNVAQGRVGVMSSRHALDIQNVPRRRACQESILGL